MKNRIVVHNIRVESIENILSTFQLTDFIDITLIPGNENSPDTLRISPSGFNDNPVTEWFDLKHINDFI